MNQASRSALRAGFHPWRETTYPVLETAIRHLSTARCCWVVQPCADKACGTTVVVAVHCGGDRTLDQPSSVPGGSAIWQWKDTIDRGRRAGTDGLESASTYCQIPR